MRTYLATVQTTDRRRQTEVGRRQKSDNSAAFRATKFSNIFLVNLFFFYVLRVRVLFVPCVCVCETETQSCSKNKSVWKSLFNLFSNVLVSFKNFRRYNNFYMKTIRFIFSRCVPRTTPTHTHTHTFSSTIKKLTDG